MRTIFPLLLVAACAPFAAAFAPSCAPLGLRNTRAVSRQSTPAGVVGLRLSSTDPDSDGYIKLEPTKTSWTGWGNSASAQKVTPIKVDPSNPTKAVEQALKAARESENINKYLGDTARWADE
ncbi:hypothetical protein T484DRAFT_1817803 [Baffinella frigidus]|nr:hypothetical protein T484DRAFT_1817803 [Cryptophyta sp. CCMP2293]